MEALAKVPESLKFTYEDYLLLPEDKHYEIIEGDLYMVPSPKTSHQMVLGNLYIILRSFVDQERLGKVLTAPYDVVLSKHDVVQPDILFVSTERSQIITDINLQGVPDLIVEITSPGTEERDREVKKKLYARFGVKEYWVIDPDGKNLDVYFVGQEGYELKGSYSERDSIESKVLEGLVVKGEKVFSL